MAIVAAEVAADDPPEFAAVTVTLRNCPISVETKLYVAEVAPVILE
jgi:hypothetical protein